MQRDLFDSELTEANQDQQPSAESSLLQTFRIQLGVDQLIFLAILILIYSVFIYGLGVATAKNINFRSLWKSWTSQMSHVQKVKPAPPPVLKTVEPAVSVAEINSVVAVVPPPVTTLPAVTPSVPSVKPSVTATEKPQENPGKKKYTIQIVASKQLDFAHKKSDKLAKLGLESFVLKEKNYHNVCVRSFMSKSQAEKFLSQLKSQGLAPRDAYVRNLS